MSSNTHWCTACGRTPTASLRARVSYVLKYTLMHSVRQDYRAQPTLSSDVCWRMLTYADVCWRMLTYAAAGLPRAPLHAPSRIPPPPRCWPQAPTQPRSALTYADVCWRMLTHADVCWRMLTHADVCWRMLTYADVCWRPQAPAARAALPEHCYGHLDADVCWRMLTYADVCWRMLTYAGTRSSRSSTWTPLWST
jgi:hypothetical protein